MKELSIEGKAKRYDEALALMQDCIPDENGLVHVRPEEIFPALKESEDERMRKGIIRNLEYLANRAEGFVKDDLKEKIAWLKKQCKQKPAEWSEEDENRINRLIAYFEDKESFTAEDDIVYANWLKSLKDRVQPNQEWSIEDELMLMSCIEIMQTVDSTEEQQKWLKSLRPQNRWKPSEEQLKSLEEVINVGHFTSYPNALETLYEQLKQL